MNETSRNFLRSMIVMVMALIGWVAVSSMFPESMPRESMKTASLITILIVVSLWVIIWLGGKKKGDK